MSAQALTEPGDNAPAWKIGTLLKGALDSLVPAFWRLVYIDSPATDRDALLRDAVRRRMVADIAHLDAGASWPDRACWAPLGPGSVRASRTA